ncbi:MAG TPA: hypothetical protein VJU78_04770 [Chitinophagaceae bacterium]|nr:hypothetical protein [Chitinophagaceae bacterium]
MWNRHWSESPLSRLPINTGVKICASALCDIEQGRSMRETIPVSLGSGEYTLTIPKHIPQNKRRFNPVFIQPFTIKQIHFRIKIQYKPHHATLQASLFFIIGINDRISSSQVTNHG